LGKEHLVKNGLISTLDKVFYFKGTIFRWSTKLLFALQNSVEISWKKFCLFQTCFLDFYGFRSLVRAQTEYSKAAKTRTDGREQRRTEIRATKRFREKNRPKIRVL
jgi:hypothetical protein